MQNQTLKFSANLHFRNLRSEIFSVFCGLLLLTGCSRHKGRVIEMESGKPISGAKIYHNGRSTVSDTNGDFSLSGVDYSKPLLVKAAGFGRKSSNVEKHTESTVRLNFLATKGLYLSQAGVGSKSIRGSVLDLTDGNEMNAIVVDIKGDRGALSIECDLPMGRQAGAITKPAIEDPDAFIEDLHRRKIYVIGRIVTFKDGPLGRLKPEWAVQEIKTKKPLMDRDKMIWMDPFRQEVWDYNIAIAKIAAEIGFDEIQFDYVRFPTVAASTIKYSKENTTKNRVAAINGFLEKASKELAPFNVYVSADIFGTVLWHRDDQGIGQKLEDIANRVDYVCPMLYPSGFGYAIPGYRTNAAAIPHEVVLESLKRATERVGPQTRNLRPWLQNFKDYSFDKREYTGQQIGLQILACNEAEAGGWLLWDAANRYRYTADALKLVANGSITNFTYSATSKTSIVTNAAPSTTKLVDNAQ
jgi:hypothetical protein